MIAKYRIGLFASSQSLLEHLDKLLQASDSDITIAYEGLDEAVPVGRKMEQNGMEVIVSRRGTAEMLRMSLDIPVLSIPTSSLDILTSLKTAADIGSKVLLPMFSKKLGNLEDIANLMKIELIQAVYKDTSSLRKVIEVAQRQDCDIIVGGSVTGSIARELGMTAVEIKTSEDVLADTLGNAKSVARSRREEQEKLYRYQCVIDASSDGIVAVDPSGRITALNQSAGQLLGCPPEDAIRGAIKEYIPKTPIMAAMRSKKPLIDRIEKIKNETFVCNHTPMMIGSEVIGAVSSFKDISKVMRAENKIRKSLSRGLVAKYHIEDLIHRSGVIQDVVAKARQFAPTDSTLLLTGSTGTGKEILTHSIHNLSSRSKGPFVSLNCAALPEQLLESELFGYEEGAFTGSKKGGKPGLFEIAHQGTIFLDEISATPLSVQVRLLRILQEKEVMRIGGDRLIPIDVRIVAAANRGMAEAVQEGSFREDLYFRLNVLRIHIPPLCQRSGDIPTLMCEFIRRAAKRHKKKPLSIPSTYMERLQGYAWPGNVRQLRNFAERLVLLCGSFFEVKIFQELFLEMARYSPQCQMDEAFVESQPLSETLRIQKQSGEADILRQALEESRYCKTKAAQKLGISRTTLWRKLKTAGIEV